MIANCKFLSQSGTSQTRPFAGKWAKPIQA